MGHRPAAASALLRRLGRVLARSPEAAALCRAPQSIEQPLGGASPSPDRHHHHLYYSTAASSSKDQTPGIGLVFDIDGVLARGGIALPAASVVRERLVAPNGREWRVPTAFLTNGGGVTEAAKAAELSSLLGVEVSPQQVALSHTPFRDALAPRLRHRPVLVAGRGDVGAVARAYGFAAAVTTRELALADPRALPFRRPGDFGGGDDDDRQKGGALVGEGFGTTAGGGDRGGGGGGADGGGGEPSSSPNYLPPPHHWGTPLAPFAAALVFSDPHDWYADLQLLLDVCETRGAPLPLPPGAEHAAALPNQADPSASFEGVYFSNPDLEWAAAHPRPRFGQGSFACAFAALHRQILQGERGLPPLTAAFFGKPTSAAARLAERLLVRHAAEAVGVTGAAAAAEALDEIGRRHPGGGSSGAALAPETGAPLAEGEGGGGAAAAAARRDVLAAVFPGGIYMVGDNPRADVRGARRAGWMSALVRTGVFRSAEANDAADPADFVVADVRAAVEGALHRGRAERWHRLR